MILCDFLYFITFGVKHLSSINFCNNLRRVKRDLRHYGQKMNLNESDIAFSKFHIPSADRPSICHIGISIDHQWWNLFKELFIVVFSLKNIGIKFFLKIALKLKFITTGLLRNSTNFYWNNEALYFLNLQRILFPVSLQWPFSTTSVKRKSLQVCSIEIEFLLLDSRRNILFSQCSFQLF